RDTRRVARGPLVHSRGDGDRARALGRSARSQRHATPDRVSGGLGASDVRFWDGLKTVPYRTRANCPKPVRSMANDQLAVFTSIWRRHDAPAVGDGLQTVP